MLRLKVSTRKIRKFTIACTIAINLAIVLLVILQIGALSITKAKTGFQGIFEILTILSTKGEDGLKEYLKDNFKKTSIISAEGFRDSLFDDLPEKIFLSLSDIKRNIKTGARISIYSLVLCGVILLGLGIFNSLFVKERRRHERYNTEATVYFSVKYDISANLEFQVIDKKIDQSVPAQKYPAICQNVSVEGMCFTSHKKLEKGNFLYLEVYPQQAKEPVHMEGEVIWSHLSTSEQRKADDFDTGVRIITVKGKSVKESIRYDETKKVIWSIVLEYIFADFTKLPRIKRGNF